MDKDRLLKSVEKGLSTWQIAAECSTSQTNVRYWLRKFNLTTNKPNKPNKKHLCLTCGEDDPNNFYGKSKERCKACFNQLRIQHFRDTRKAAVEFLGGKCTNCGYDSCIAALDIHHLNSSLKDPNFNTMSGWSWERIIREIETCVLLCKNCHASIHYCQ